MSKEEILEKLQQSITEMDEELAKETATAAVEAGLDPLECISEGLSKGMQVMSDLFDEGEAFVPELLVASEAFDSAVKILTSTLSDDQKNSTSNGKVLIHTVQGDIHDIGKNIVRPMLAPNLYDVSQKLMNISKLPLRIFEIGSCFRKESEGNVHLKEFTMLNLVEWGTPEEERLSRLKELAAMVLDAAQIGERYRLEEESSVVYGKGLDVVGLDGLELASTSMGPHPLDAAWKVSCTWVGIDFGLERLLMYRENEQGIHRYAKSISFLDGARINIK